MFLCKAQQINETALNEQVLHKNSNYLYVCKMEPLCELACLIELKTKFNLEIVISMQLRNMITVVKNIRINNLSLLSTKCKMQLFSV